MSANENKFRNVETWASIYGIFNIIISGIAIFVGMGFTVYFNLNHLENASFSSLIMVSLAPGPGLLFLPFSIVLVYGIGQKNPSLVLTYFIFGIIFSLLTVAAFIYSYYILQAPQIAATCLIVYLIYTLPLILVFLTFKKMQTGEHFAYSNKF